MKYTTYMIMALVLMVPAYATFIQTVNCDDLFSNQFTPQNVFNEPADVCFYGSGYSTSSMDLYLSNSDNTYNLYDVEVTNGIITSINGDHFNDVAAGEYSLGVTDGEGCFEYSLPIIVNGQENPEEPPVEPPVGDVPEFTTTAAIAVLAGAGMFIHMKRRQK